MIYGVLVSIYLLIALGDPFENIFVESTHNEKTQKQLFQTSELVLNANEIRLIIDNLFIRVM